jgi:hypothetical protein
MELLRQWQNNGILNKKLSLHLKSIFINLKILQMEKKNPFYSIHNPSENWVSGLYKKTEADPRPKDYTPQQIKKLAVDLKERITGFMTAAFRNEETTGFVDYNKANEFLISLDNTIDKIDCIIPKKP